MPAEEQMRRRAEIEGALGMLGALLEGGRAPEGALREHARLVDAVRAPVRIVVAGAVGAGKSALVEALFGGALESGTELVASWAAGIRAHAHRDVAGRLGLPPGVGEVRVELEGLRGFCVIDAPGVRAGDAVQHRALEGCMEWADVALFCLDAADPWRGEAWDFLVRSRTVAGERLALVLSRADLVEPEELASRLRHLRQTAARKFSDPPPVLAASARAALQTRAGSGVDDIDRFIDDLLLPPHRAACALLEGIDSTVDLLEDGLERLRGRDADLVADERALIGLERELIDRGLRQCDSFEWLEGEISAGTDPACDGGAADFEAAAIGSATETLLGGARAGVGALHEGVVGRVIATLLPPAGRAMAGFEGELRGIWERAIGELRPGCVEELGDRLAQPPAREEARVAALGRMGQTARETVGSLEATARAGELLAEARGAAARPIRIALGTVPVALATAFAGGGWAAGLAIGLVGAGWALAAWSGVARRRRSLAGRYRELLRYRVLQSLCALRAEMGRFGGETLIEMTRVARATGMEVASSRARNDELLRVGRGLQRDLRGIAGRLGEGRA